MFEKTKFVGAVLALLSGVATAQTIDEIVELNRQAALAEAKSKVETAKRGGSTPVPLPSGSGSAMPALPLPPGPPAAGAIAPVGSWKPIATKKERSAPPVLIAIYGVGSNLLAELSEGGIEGKYREGDKTPGGWTVGRIDKRSVDVTRHIQGKRKSAKFEKVALAFATRVDVPKEPASTSREPATTGPVGYSVPPLPPSFPANR